MNRYLLALTLLAALTAVARPSNLGAEAIDEAMTKAADEIKRRVQSRPAGERTVAISSLTCPTDLRATGGALLAKKLEDELKKRGLVFRSRASVVLTGEYRDVSGSDASTVEKASIRLRLEDRAGEPIDEPIVVTVEGLEALTLLFPGLVAPGKAGIAVEPKMAVKKTRVFGHETGKFAVEILVAGDPSVRTKESDYRVTEPRLDEGLARVDIRRNQAYAVRLHNLSDEDAAVELFIDGLSMFEFNEAKDSKDGPKPRFVLVRKRSVGLVRGWYVNPKVSDLFYVTERDKSVAYSRMMLRDLGTITARFHACWERTDEKPKDEPKFSERDGSGTGVGHYLAPVTVKPVKLRVGVIRESIPVLYSRPER